MNLTTFRSCPPSSPQASPFFMVKHACCFKYLYYLPSPQKHLSSQPALVLHTVPLQYILVNQQIPTPPLHSTYSLLLIQKTHPIPIAPSFLCFSVLFPWKPEGNINKQEDVFLSSPSASSPGKEEEHQVSREIQDFSGPPVVKTPCFQYSGCTFDPWSGN